MSRSILRRDPDSAALRDAALIDDFLEELSSIAARFFWEVNGSCGNGRCGIRGQYPDKAGWVCPLGAVWAARTGYREWFQGEGHLLKLLAKMDRELRIGTVSLKIAEAIDDPFGDRDSSNAPLGRAILRAVGLKIEQSDEQHRRWG